VIIINNHQCRGVREACPLDIRRSPKNPKNQISQPQKPKSLTSFMGGFKASVTKRINQWLSRTYGDNRILSNKGCMPYYKQGIYPTVGRKETCAHNVISTNIFPHDVGRAEEVLPNTHLF
jgi:hypothetical protein